MHCALQIEKLSEVQGAFAPVMAKLSEHAHTHLKYNKLNNKGKFCRWSSVDDATDRFRFEALSLLSVKPIITNIEIKQNRPYHNT
jgi:hypothetical protein